MNYHRVHFRDSTATEPLHVSRGRRPCWIVGACLACLASFFLGFRVSDRRLDSKVNEAADMRIKDFVQFCDAIGVLDKDALTEAIITASEAEWENRDAEQCEAKGGK